MPGATHRSWIVSTALIYAVVNLFCFGVSVYEPELGFLVVGGGALSFATIILTAGWAVLGPGSYWSRSRDAFAFVSLVGLGAMLPLMSVQTAEEVVVVLCFPFVWMSAQLPFWPLKFMANWRIETRKGSNTVPLSITDLVFLTTAIAVSLGLIQLVPQILKMIYGPGRAAVEFGLEGLYSFGVIMFVLALFFGVPSYYFLLAYERKRDDSNLSKKMNAELYKPDANPIQSHQQAEEGEKSESVVMPISQAEMESRSLFAEGSGFSCFLLIAYLLFSLMILGSVGFLFSGTTAFFLSLYSLIFFAPLVFFLACPLLLLREQGVRLASASNRQTQATEQKNSTGGNEVPSDPFAEEPFAEVDETAGGDKLQ